MNDLPPSSPPLPERSSPQGGHRDLDARILAAEHAVIERDRRVRDDARSLMHRVRETTRHNARIAAAATLGSFALGWLLAHRTPKAQRKRAAGKEGDIERRMPALAEAPWAGIIPLLWPLLPVTLRSRVSPGVASFVTGLGMPLLAQFLGRRRARAKLKQDRQQHTQRQTLRARGGDSATTLH